MIEQSLAQLLKEARDFSDYQKVEARIVEQLISRDEAMGALLRLTGRVEALEQERAAREANTGELERILDDSLLEMANTRAREQSAPRPPTRLGDEFPEPNSATATAEALLRRLDPESDYSTIDDFVEDFHAQREALERAIGSRVSSLLNPDYIRNLAGKAQSVIQGMREQLDVAGFDNDDSVTRAADARKEIERLRAELRQLRFGAPAPNPPSKAVRVDSLPVGATCWMEAKVVNLPPYANARLVALDFNVEGHYYASFPRDTLVLPVEPSAKTEPTEQWDTVKGSEPALNAAAYHAKVEELWPTKPKLGRVEPVKPRPEWDGYTIQAVRGRLCKERPEYTDLFSRICFDMLRELEVKS